VAVAGVRYSNPFEDELYSHTYHLASDIRYMRGCAWCELKPKKQDEGDDARFYALAQIGTAKTIRF
jgi:CRISPR/Cas system-associated protein Cas10 (large subunit of type III CRISPR-Cas system)